MLFRASKALRQARHQNVGQKIVDPRNIIRAGIAASVGLHLSFLALALFFSEVRPFGPVAAENVAVDIVTPDQVPDKAPEPAPTPQPQTSIAFDLSSKPAPDSSPSSSPPANSSSANSSPFKPSQSSASQSSASEATAGQPAAAAQSAAAAPQPAASQSQTQPQQQAALTPSKPASNPVPGAASTPDQQQPAMQPQASMPAQSPPPAYVQPQPDISVKYHVQLGLPQNRPGDPFDPAATENADIEANSIVEFRRHLRSCSRLPGSIAPTDDLAIKLRVKFTRDGRLAGEPLLVQAKASPTGPLLIQAAIGALRSCQPYTMLPADKYNEWKVLDFTFTPRDFDAS
jgi:hypothetical protein